MQNVRTRRRHDRAARWRRLRALLAGGLVLGAGASVTLASWTDTEWVFGSTGGDVDDPPIGTSQFNIVQDVHDGVGFTDRETRDGGALDFTATAANLSPGVTVYAPLDLAADQGSIGGTLVLKGALAGTGTDQTLFDALTYEVRTSVPRAGCSAAGMASGTVLVPAGTALGVGSGTTSFAVAAGGDVAVGTPTAVCFALTLPAGASSSLQGQVAVPVWEFVATSTP